MTAMTERPAPTALGGEFGPGSTSRCMTDPPLGDATRSVTTCYRNISELLEFSNFHGSTVAPPARCPVRRRHAGAVEPERLDRHQRGAEHQPGELVVGDRLRHVGLHQHPPAVLLDVLAPRRIAGLAVVEAAALAVDP